MKRKIPKWLKNKYIVTAILFVVWITFFDSNDLIKQVGYLSHLHQLRDQKAYLENQIDTIDHQLKDLTTNPEKLKEFAREKYLMKKPNEDVFIIKEKEQ